jgi:LmbE family N-acetylglucosaminyl deacetylase
MSKEKQKKPKTSLVVVAHPDDETLFFAGKILSQPKKNWHVVCVTDGNADGMGAKRHQDFKNACRALGAKKVSFLELPDKFDQRLNLSLIENHLETINQNIKEVYTHGPIGEYGHPHHQDVCFATHLFFKAKKIPVWGVAQNCHPEQVVNLSPAQFQKKCSILQKIYFSETERFVHFIPSQFSEGFARFSFKEVEHLYDYFCDNAPLDLKKLSHYRWFAPYLTSFKQRVVSRPF